jgi:hypothetical protein
VALRLVRPPFTFRIEPEFNLFAEERGRQV